MIKIEELMTRNPHTLVSDDTLMDAKKLMQEKEIRHIPVVSAEGKLLGIVTHRDILAAQESSLNDIDNCSDITLATPLKDVMHTNIMTVVPQAGLRESATYMQKHKVGCLPVVQDKKLVGIITDTDFVTIAIHLLELQEEVEPTEIDLEDMF